MKKTIVRSVLAAGLMLAVSLVAGAQGPPPGGFGGRGPEGHGGPGGPGGPGGLMGGGGKCTAPCTPYQFSFTITSTEPVLVNGAASTVTNTTTGTIARDANGSTYRDVKGAGFGPWASQGGPQELIFIRNLDPAVMMNYLVNVTKGTYEQFAIKAHTPGSGKGPGEGMHKGGPGGNAPTPTAVNYPVLGGSAFTCAAEQTTFSHSIQLSGGGNATITTNRVFCPALQIVLEEDHNDPRFGTRKYLLSDYVASPSAALFMPPTGTTLVQGGKSSHGGPRGFDKQPPPPPMD